MTTDRDLDRQLASWFRERATNVAPEGLLLRALERVGTTAQRPAWLAGGPGRARPKLPRGAWPPLARGRLLAVAAAAVVVVAGTALLLGTKPATIGGPTLAPVPSGSASPSVPDIGPGPGRFAFVENGRLWVADADGSAAHELATGLSGVIDAPAWTPDHARLLVTVMPTAASGPDASRSRIYEVDANSGAARLLDTGCVAPCTGDGDAAFSADGTHLVFVRTVDVPGPGTLLATMDLATGVVTELGSARADGTANRIARPRWSPDGTLIAYDLGNSAVIVTHANGAGTNHLVAGVSATGASWSPDGTSLVLAVVQVRSDATVHRFFDIATVRPDGTGLRRLTTDGYSLDPTWLDDGRIGFSRLPSVDGNIDGAGPQQLWVMDPDGSGQGRIALSSRPVRVPSIAWPVSPIGAVVVPATRAWTPTGALGTARMLASATRLHDGRVLLVGGMPGDPQSRGLGATLASTELYTPATGAWTPGATLSVARSGQTATLLRDGRVLVAGGAQQVSYGGWADRNTATAELFDPATGLWTPTGSMGTPRSGHTATLLADGRVLVAGGVEAVGTSNVPLSSAEIYDPTTGSWAPTGSLATSRIDQAAVRLADGRVLVAGGETYTGDATGSWPSLTSAEIYDPAAGTWTPTAPMTGARRQPAAVLLSDGRVLVVGGGTADVRDPVTGTWVRTVTLSGTPPGELTSLQVTASSLADGRVLVVGNRGAAVFDPARGMWMATPGMIIPRDAPHDSGLAAHTATLLLDGTVLVAGGGGGASGQGGDFDMAEVFDPTAFP